MISGPNREITSIPDHAFYAAIAFNKAASSAYLIKHYQANIKGKKEEIERLSRISLNSEIEASARDKAQANIPGQNTALNQLDQKLIAENRQLQIFLAQQINAIPLNFSIDKKYFQEKLKSDTNNATVTTTLFDEFSKWYFVQIIQINLYIGSNAALIENDLFAEDRYQNKALTYLALFKHQKTFEEFFKAIIYSAENNKRDQFLSLIGTLVQAINFYTDTNFFHDFNSEQEPEEEQKYDEYGLKFAVDAMFCYLVAGISTKQLSLLHQALNTSELNSIIETGKHGEVFDDALSTLRHNVNDRFERERIAEQLLQYLPGINSLEQLYIKYRKEFLAEQKKSSFFQACSCTTAIASPIRELITEDYGRIEIHLEEINITQDISHIIDNIYGFSECENMYHSLTFFKKFAELIKQIELNFSEMLRESNSSSDLTTLHDNACKSIPKSTLILSLALIDKYTPRFLSTDILIKQQAYIAKRLYQAKENPIIGYYYQEENCQPLLTRTSSSDHPRLSSIDKLDKERKRFLEHAKKQAASEALNEADKIELIKKANAHHKRFQYLQSIKSLLNDNKYEDAGRKVISFFGQKIEIGNKSDGRERFETITQKVEDYADYSPENERALIDKYNLALALKNEKQQIYNSGWGLGVRTAETIKLYQEIANLPLPNHYQGDIDVEANFVDIPLDEETVINASSRKQSIHPTQHNTAKIVPVTSTKYSENSYQEQPTSKIDSEKMLRTPTSPTEFFAKSPQHGTSEAIDSGANHPQKNGYSLLVKHRSSWSGNRSDINSDGQRTCPPSPLPDYFDLHEGEMNKVASHSSHLASIY